MADIPANEWELRASIVGEMITAGATVALGVMLLTLASRVAIDVDVTGAEDLASARS